MEAHINENGGKISQSHTDFFIASPISATRPLSIIEELLILWSNFTREILAISFTIKHKKKTCEIYI